MLSHYNYKANLPTRIEDGELFGHFDEDGGERSAQEKVSVQKESAQRGLFCHSALRAGRYC